MAATFLAEAPGTARHRAPGTARRPGLGTLVGLGCRGRHRATGLGRIAFPVRPTAGGRPTPARPTY
jgi:hypothetical protein